MVVVVIIGVKWSEGVWYDDAVIVVEYIVIVKVVVTIVV
jgi:hypothetical protein